MSISIFTLASAHSPRPVWRIGKVLPTTCTGSAPSGFFRERPGRPPHRPSASPAASPTRTGASPAESPPRRSPPRSARPRPSPSPCDRHETLKALAVRQHPQNAAQVQRLPAVRLEELRRSRDGAPPKDSAAKPGTARTRRGGRLNSAFLGMKGEPTGTGPAWAH